MGLWNRMLGAVDPRMESEAPAQEERATPGTSYAVEFVCRWIINIIKL